VQISEKELDRYGITPYEFGEEFYTPLTEENILGSANQAGTFQL
jgi:hypothetical protein